ncbi:MAG: hypothetical protein LBH95_02815, partial [Oscillospiraceae bacterium]|nr:hypothetical protein [Oscillospiraceae bacterium]
MKKPLSARFGYVVSLAVALIAAAALGGAVTYGAAAALLLLPAAALLLAWRAERQLSVRHALDCENCLRGGAARYAVQLRNTGFIPVTWVSARFASSRGGQNADRPSGAGFGPEKERDSLSGESAVFEVSLAPFHTFRHETLFTPPHRGVYALSVESVRVSDPFRLTTLSGRRPETLTLTVMPRLIPISEAWKQRLDPQGAGGIFSQSSDEPAVDSRTYRYGDSPRRIH